MRLKGSYTIEAAFLLPIITTIIVLLIYLSFFIHDRALITSIAYISALRGSQIMGKSQNEIYEVSENSSYELIGENLLGMKNINREIQVTDKEVIVKYSGKVGVPGNVLAVKLLSNTDWEISVKQKAKRIDAVKFIRRCRKLEELID